MKTLSFFIAVMATLLLTTAFASGNEKPEVQLEASLHTDTQTHNHTPSEQSVSAQENELSNMITHYIRMTGNYFNAFFCDVTDKDLENLDNLTTDEIGTLIKSIKANITGFGSIKTPIDLFLIKHSEPETNELREIMREKESSALFYQGLLTTKLKNGHIS